MKHLKRIGISAFAFLLTVIVFGVADAPILGLPSVVPEAHAVVGRPLSPVSVAGTSRRTVRRCAADVYDC